MPYIKEEDREKFIIEHADGSFTDLLEEVGKLANTAGDLNYAFTVISQAYLATKGKRYQQMNDIIGALEGCKLELYRRIAAPYEDQKIKESGDVFDPRLK